MQLRTHLQPLPLAWMLLSTLLQLLLLWLRLYLLHVLLWPTLLLRFQLGLVPIPKVQRGSSIIHAQGRLVQPTPWRLLPMLRLLARPVAMLQRWRCSAAAHC